MNTTSVQCNLHEQFASDVDLQELFALTARQGKIYCTLNINEEYNHIRNILKTNSSRQLDICWLHAYTNIQENDNIEHSSK